MSRQNRLDTITLRPAGRIRGTGHRRPWRAYALGAVLAGVLALPASGAAAQTPQFLYQFGTQGSGLGQFDLPGGVAVDAAGHIVVADLNNNRIQICDVSDPSNVTCQAFGSAGTDPEQFDDPVDVALDGAGKVVVADATNNRIQICDVSGFPTVTCQAFGSAGTDPGQFDVPVGVAVDAAGKVVVADTNNHRIQICDVSDLSTNNVTCQAFGSLGTGLGQFKIPRRVAVDATGKVVIADSGNYRIQICDVSGLPTVTCQAFGSQGSGLGQFNPPFGVAVDDAGHLVVADDNDRVQICDVSGLPTVSCQAFGSGPGDGPGEFNNPSGVAVDGDNIVVADTDNHRIEVFGADTDGDGVPDANDACPNSELASTVVIDGCDAGVANALDATGCTISDLVAGVAAGAKNHGKFVSGVAHLLNDLKKSGVISGGDKGAIQRCAAQADLP
jgi:NHL repeat